MTSKTRTLRRIAYAMAALALFVGASFPALRPVVAHAAAQLAARSITLSDSGVSGGTITSGVGSGLAVSYKVGFTTSVAAQSLVIDFCQNDPIISDTCNNTTPQALGMNAAAATLVGISGNITSPGWTVTASQYQIKLAKGAGSAASIGAQVFALTGITNPTHLGTFYARIYTYNDTTWGGTTTPYSNATTLGDYKDYGGVALSTNQIITITARVQETLAFCVSGANPTTWNTNNDCSDPVATAAAPALILGHGSPTAILDTSATDSGTVYSQISTNATTGAVISMRNSNTTCGGLSANGGTTCDIPASATGANTPAAIIPGTAAFGMYCTNGVPDVNGIGTVTADLNYNDGTATHYGMDTETVSDAGSVTGTYGDSVAASTAPVYRIDNSYTFAATASLTTPAGIYTANLDLVATGTF
ncbi:MAG: hypothetical protein ABI602_04145 [Candidatus Saccharibacteria bacterium]